MKATGNAVALATLLFLIVRILGATIGGVIAEIAIMLLAVGIPAAFLFAIGALGGCRDLLRPPRRDAVAYLPLLPIFILALNLLASLSTLLAALVGLNRTILPSGPLPLAIFSSAVLPALTEELFCRVLCLHPFRKSAPAAVWLSASVFAALHMNFAQIPYAFAAGLFFGALTLTSGSIHLAILFHFISNLLSVLFWYFQADGTGMAVLLTVYLFSLVVSLVLLSRRKCRAALSRLWEILRPGRSDWSVIKDVFRSCFSIPILFCLLFSLL